MGRISKALAARFSKATPEVERLRAESERSGQAWPTAKGVSDPKKLVETGYDPLHAIYVSTQNLVSVFSESVSTFDELEPYYNVVVAAEDEYMPSGPPMSPLTTSYFTLWAFFDLRFGPDAETIGACFLDLADFLHAHELTVEVVRQFVPSRMGIYEHGGRVGDKTRLIELATGRESICHVASSYEGQAGELWYARLCPPLPCLAQVADYHVVMTTPYVLINTSRADWTAYIKKNLLGSKYAPTEERLDHLLKYGTTPTSWLEFVFQAYHHHIGNAIFLAGLPDVKASRPHSDLGRDR